MERTVEREQTRRKPKDYYAPRKRLVPSMKAFRSSITNGSEILHDLDHRSAWARRFKDLLCAHISDLGGDDNLSEGQRSIVRRIVVLETQLEFAEQKFADNDGCATDKQLQEYQRCSNTLRRLFESLNLHKGRKARTIPSPLDYAKHKQIEAAT